MTFGHFVTSDSYNFLADTALELLSYLESLKKRKFKINWGPHYMNNYDMNKSNHNAHCSCISKPSTMKAHR